METLTDMNWILSVGVFLPMLGVLIMMFIPRDDEVMAKTIGIATAGATLAIGIVTLINFDYSSSEKLQFFVNTEWIPVINSNYTLGLDGISLPLYFLSMAVTFLVMIYSWDNMPDAGNPKAFFILMLILQTGMAGTFVAQDLILFFVFFELVLLPMYFMIGVWGGEQRQYASLKFFLYTMFGSAFMLVAILALYFQAGAESFGFQYLINAGAGIDRDVQVWIFAGFFLGFAIKVPMFPFHTWLPDAHTQAPTQGSVILAAILLKLGTYGFIRIAIPMLPEGAKAWAPVIAVLAVIGIIYGALGCLAQTDMKRLIAFSSVAHMGFVMLGISTLTTFGINAALFGMVAHGLITGMLFFVAGSIKHRYHTLEIKRLSGMLIQMPRMGWILGFAAMASLGLPGLAGFWGEFPAILSAYSPGFGLSEPLYRTLMVIAAIGTVLAAGYLLWLYQRTAFGEPGPEFAGHSVAEHDAAHLDGGHGHVNPPLAHSLSSAANTMPGDGAEGSATDEAHGAAGQSAAATAGSHQHGSASDEAHGAAGQSAAATAGTHQDDHEEIRDVTMIEWIAWTPFLVAIVVFGVYPQLMFKIFDPGVQLMVDRLGQTLGK